MLWAEREGAGRRLVLVHGFTQTGRHWAPLAGDLATDHEVVRVDAPGHGRSGGVTADLWTGAGLVAEQGGEATYVGYSMGGRLCLHVALARPDLVRGLVLVGATAGIDDPAERASAAGRRRGLARRLEADGLEPFLDRLAGPAPVRRPAGVGRRRGGPAGEHAGRAGLEPASDRDRRPGAVVGPPGRAVHAGAGRGRRAGR